MAAKTTNFLRRAVCSILAVILMFSLVPAASAASGYDSPGQKLLALTFDDGPGPYSDQILDTLKKHGAKATFFMNGYKIPQHADQVRRMAAEGHQIANHTYDHPQLTKLTDAKIKQEVNSTAQALTEATGLTGTGATGFYLRPPYGDRNNRVAAAAGVPLVLWNVDTQDWKYRDANRLVSYTGGIAKDGDIVLMHETHQSTAQGLDALLTVLESKGFEMVTVEEMLWRRGVTAQAGQAYFSVKGTGVERCSRALWYDETHLDAHWAYPAIRSVLEQGWMDNNEYGEFLPNFPLTRGMFVTALGRLYGVSAEAPFTSVFVDVPADLYAAPYVAWAKADGVMTGVSPKYFDPDRPITRQEMAVVLSRYTLLLGLNADTSSSPSYADQDQLAAWAVDGVARCSALGLLEGSGGKYFPNDTATRAMGAVVLERLNKLFAPAADAAE